MLYIVICTLIRTDFQLVKNKNSTITNFDTLPETVRRHSATDR